jgi:hypothetical protein
VNVKTANGCDLSGEIFGKGGLCVWNLEWVLRTGEIGIERVTKLYHDSLLAKLAIHPWRLFVAGLAAITVPAVDHGRLVVFLLVRFDSPVFPRMAQRVVHSWP